MSMYLEEENEHWGKPVLAGKYDIYFFNALSKLPTKGKVIFDVGAHIGLSSLPFAKMVGSKGKVIAFEPNPANRERLLLNLERNPKLASAITIESLALSNVNGTQDFLFTENIEDGTSSGSFLSGAHTLMKRTVYEEELRFQKMKVTTQTLEKYCKAKSIVPDIIKIDVEGAEYLVIEGAKTILRKHKPTLFIELHSIFNGYKVTEQLLTMGYTISVLHEEKDGRCFIAAE